MKREREREREMEIERGRKRDRERFVFQKLSAPGIAIETGSDQLRTH